jgi:Bifunctional DNA primase/polymerase, N-terminal/Primase C terminal 2 (PriCT-2)
MNAICAAAIAYAQRGWLVFPAHSSGKKKSHKAAKYSNGRQWGKTVDLNEIRANWHKWPKANVGIVTGVDSKVFVVEADTPEGHKVDGIASLRALEAEHGKLPKTLMAESPTGSLHHYFNYPVGTTIVNSTSRIGPGIDVLAQGGMVLGPPSVRPGVGKYRWLNQNAIADAPSWLIKLTIKADTPRVPKIECSAELDLLFAALGAIPNENVGWDIWNTVGMAIWRSSDGTGFAVFDEWSRKSLKYNEHKTREKWLEYSKYPPDRIGIGSILHWANELSPGWADEYWRKVEEIFTRPNDPETRQRQIAWMKEHVWK